MTDKVPTGDPTTIAIPLYPRSPQVLLDILEEALIPDGTPMYAAIDVDNLRNHLRAHLQRVALGR